MPHSTYPRRTPDDVVIVGGARTPQGRINGQFASFSASDLGARALAGALSKSGVSAAQIDAVIMGQVVQAGSGQNPARQTAIKAGLGWNVPGAWSPSPTATRAHSQLI
jgi:acetyl-CoA C-acetyltransferase